MKEITEQVIVPLGIEIVKHIVLLLEDASRVDHPKSYKSLMDSVLNTVKAEAHNAISTRQIKDSEIEKENK